MSGNVGNYDARRLIVMLAGRLISEGFSEDDHLSIEYTSDGYTKTTGVDGYTGRARIADESARVTISLLQTSPANLILETIYQLDRNTPAGAGVGFFSINDINGPTIYAARCAWIAKRPDPAWGRDIKTRDWMIDAGRMNAVEGGSFSLNL